MKILISLFVIWTLSACSSTNKKEDVMTPSGGVTDSTSIDLEGGADGADSSSFGLDENGAVILDPLDDPASELFVRTIYFEYDSADLTEQSMSTVREHGRYLSSNPSRQVRLEGHADERGTREYNLALGESRAKSVREILVLEGAQQEQVEIVSFGEERPAVEGDDESALQLNRRVEIVY
jgi:peptidoglycan-associated lipoprotein